MAYLLDTNVFVQAKNFHYGFAVCPGFWFWLDYATKKGLVLSLKQVRAELMAKEDELSSWVKPRKNLFVDSDDGKTFDSLKILSDWVSNKYEDFAQADFFAAADFYLVGYAHAHNHIVVTHEAASNGHAVKIPNACKALGVRCMTPFDMLKTEQARFVFETPYDDDEEDDSN